MSSKSSSSIVKSVESTIKSVMPKNMNMKHVLLAVLVGLLLCMLIGNTVEGLTTLTINEAGDLAVDDPAVPERDNAKGYCHHNSLLDPAGSGLSEVCEVDGELAVPDGQTVAPADVNKGNSICNSDIVKRAGCVGDSSQPSLNAGQAIVRAMTNAGLADNIDYTLKCKQGASIDTCSGDYPTKAACQSEAAVNQNCEWEECNFTGGDTFMMGADNADPDKASVAYDSSLGMSEYERWNRCIFNNTGTYGNRGFAQNPDAAAIINPYASNNDGNLTGLYSWLDSKDGIRRNKGDEVPTDAAQLLTEKQRRNIIPMNNDGTVPDSIKTILPSTWVTGFENMYKYCKQGLPANADAMIGWTSSGRSLQCINHNDNLAHKCIQYKIPKFDCTCGQPGCDGDAESSETPGTIAGVLQSNCSIGDKISSAGSVTFGHAPTEALGVAASALFQAADGAHKQMA
jgi:hypothetical protein